MDRSREFMDILKSYGVPVAIVVCLIIYVILVGTTYTTITDIKAGDADTSSYSTTIPGMVVLSGILMGLMMGLYAYSTINTGLVFGVSIGISCLALALSFSALGVAAMTH